MMKRLLLFALIIAGVLYFGMRDDADKTETKTDTPKTTEEGETKEEETSKEEASTEENTTSTEVDKEKTTTAETTTKKPVETKPVAKTVVKTTTSPAIGTTTTTEVVAKPVYVAPKYNGQSDVTVYLYDWAIDLSSIEVPAGNVTFTVKNTGTFSHNFGIKGGTDFGRVNPGATAIFNAYVTPGAKTLYSSNKRDIERGMEEGFTVQ